MQFCKNIYFVVYFAFYIDRLNCTPGLGQTGQLTQCNKRILHRSTIYSRFEILEPALHIYSTQNAHTHKPNAKRA